MSNENDDAENRSVLQTLTDELQLQSWLAEAELRNPSDHDEVSSLAQLRDELRVQLHLGKLEARDEFERIEQMWRDVKNRAARAADDAEDQLQGLLKRIRDGYQGLRGQ